MKSEAFLYMGLLAVQYGIQPILTKEFTSSDVERKSVVLVQEVVKFAMAGSMLLMSGGGKAAIQSWSVTSWISVALVPAGLYCIQNLSALLACQNLDAVTYNVLNQTKTLSAALCCYLVMGRKQSKMQIVALLLLLLSALVLERIVNLDFLLSASSEEEDASDKTVEVSSKHLTHGVAPVLLASFLSGLAGALSQKNLQGSNSRNSYFFTMELCMATTIMLVITSLTSSDSSSSPTNFEHWTPTTIIPILTNAAGGILVGLVTKHAGSVKKGFALIFGLLISGILQATLKSDDGLQKEHIIGGILASISLYLHGTNPYVAPLTTADAKKKKE
mmetsp:Transcript_29003/g.43772  ORF Transcript_29003/g.43772 Transcript_29003/m.43772 type:complete len:332 (+) Transcript_29003:52-1047(+)